MSSTVNGNVIPSWTDMLDTDPKGDADALSKVLTALCNTVDSSSRPISYAGYGTAASGSTAVEWGTTRKHHTILTVNTTLGAIAGGASLGLGKLLYTFPAGAIRINSVRMSIAITQTQAHINADTPDVGLGTVVASGAVATLDGTATFENILTGQTATNCTGTATVKTAACTLCIESADSVRVVYLNVADGWAASGDAAAILTGTVALDWDILT
jgi:hypothetical protein